MGTWLCLVAWCGWLLGKIILNINCSIKCVLACCIFVDDGLNLISAVLWAVAGTGCTILAEKCQYKDNNLVWQAPNYWPSWRAGLSKVHDFLRVGVDQDGPGHGCRGSVLASSGQVASLSTVMLLLDKVIPKQVMVNHDFFLLFFSSSPRSEGHQVRVVGGGRDGDTPGAADVGVAQLVSKLLQLVRVKVVIIPENVVVARSRGALDTWEQREY